MMVMRPMMDSSGDVELEVVTASRRSKGTSRSVPICRIKVGIRGVRSGPLWSSAQANVASAVLAFHGVEKPVVLSKWYEESFSCIVLLWSLDRSLLRERSMLTEL